MNSIQARNMEICHELGHLVAAIDEEAFNLRDMDTIAKEIDPKALDHATVYATSPLHATAYKSVWEQADVIVTGNPRASVPKYVDLYKDESKAIKDTFGNFTLVCSNVGAINSKWGDLGLFAGLLQHMRWFEGRNRFDLAEWIEYEAMCLSTLVQTAALYAAGGTVVVRPHPSENMALWEFLTGSREPNSKIYVIPTGNHLAWIDASQMVVHAGDTMGYEAGVMGKTVHQKYVGHPWSDRYGHVEYRHPELLTPQRAIADDITSKVYDVKRGFQLTIPTTSFSLYEREKMNITHPEVSKMYEALGGNPLHVHQVAHNVFEVHPEE
jgi:surface carbohydrate biosynthesis protein